MRTSRIIPFAVTCVFVLCAGMGIALADNSADTDERDVAEVFSLDDLTAPTDAPMSGETEETAQKNVTSKLGSPDGPNIERPQGPNIDPLPSEGTTPTEEDAQSIIHPMFRNGAEPGINPRDPAVDPMNPADESNPVPKEGDGGVPPMIAPDFDPAVDPMEPEESNAPANLPTNLTPQIQRPADPALDPMNPSDDWGMGPDDPTQGAFSNPAFDPYSNPLGNNTNPNPNRW